ncbi:hypothetical protein HA385_24310, partial [Escherichia coli]|nr:hypothetical protein [Escherichia coli]
RFQGRGQGRWIPEQKEEEFACYYCQVPGHLSRECPMRIRHQAEKRGGQGRMNNEPAEIQVIHCIPAEQAKNHNVSVE